MSQQDPEELVKTAFALPRRQLDALRRVAIEEDRSMGYYVRKAVDKWLGYDKLTVDPQANEQEARR